MIKMTVVGRRRPGMTLEQVHDYFKNVHGALIVGHCSEAKNEAAPIRYVQNHVFDGTYRALKKTGGGAADPFALNRDFIAQLWFESPDQARAAMETSFYIDVLKPDEARFVDMPTVIEFLATEIDVAPFNGSRGTFKLFRFLKRSPAMSYGDFLQAWRQESSSLVASPAMGSVLRYVRNVPIERGPSNLVDGVDEFWLESREAVYELLSASQQSEVAAKARSGMHRANSFFLAAQEFVLL